MYAGIVDLPDELLSVIGVFLDTHSLYYLAQVNRKFYHFCIPICLGRFGIQDPEKHAKVLLDGAQEDSERQQHTVDAISVLQLASFHIKTIDRISCNFSIPGNDISLVLLSVRRLEQLIRRLSAVRSVSLSFTGEHCCCCGTPHFEEGWLEEWSLGIGGLLSAILEKSAETVKLKGGRYLSHLFVFRFDNRRPGSSSKTTSTPLDALKFMFKGKKESKSHALHTEPLSVLKGDNWEFKRVNHSHVGLSLAELLPSAQVNSKIRSLNIQSMMFLMPPLLQWTISAMQYSNLRKLTLNNLSINHKCWPAIFDLVTSAAPGLTELTLQKLRQIMPNDLLHFLSRLPMLTSLSLARDVDSWDSYELGPFPDLPKLVTLSAPSPWIVKLLTAQGRGLESLETLNISYKLRNDGLGHWLQPSATPSIPGLLRAQQRLLTVSVEVVLGSSPGWKMFEDLSTLADNDSDRRLVSSITLVVNQDFAKEDMRLWTVLPRWLAMFPAVRQLCLNGNNPTLDRVDTMEMMKEAVKASGLQLESLKLNGKEGAAAISSVA